MSVEMALRARKSQDMSSAEATDRHHLTIGGLDRGNDVFEALSVDGEGRIISSPSSSYAEVDILSGLPETAIGAIWEDIGAVIQTNNMNIRLELDIDDVGSTKFEFRAKMVKTLAGTSYFPEMSYDGDASVLTPRIHELDPTTIAAAGELSYIIILTGGFPFCQIQARFTSPGTAGDIDSAVAVLV